MTTRAFSQNIGKLFFKLKLVTDNLLFIYAIHWSTHTHTIVTRLWLQPWWSNHARLDWLTFGVSECWALKLSTRYYMNRNWKRTLLTVVTSGVGTTSKVQQQQHAIRCESIQFGLKGYYYNIFIHHNNLLNEMNVRSQRLMFYSTECGKW